MFLQYAGLSTNSGDLNCLEHTLQAAVLELVLWKIAVPRQNAAKVQHKGRIETFIILFANLQ